VPILGGGYAKSLLVATDFYTLYAEIDNAATPKRNVTLYDDTGTALLTSADPGYSVNMSTAASNGAVTLGQSIRSASPTGIALEVDGAAIYSARLTGAAKYQAPAATDANLLSMVTFDEGSGSTAANSVTGAQSFTLTNQTWVSGGTWDNAAASSVHSKVGHGLVNAGLVNQGRL